MSKSHVSYLSKRIANRLSPNAPTPHVLVELSMKEVSRLAPNTIHLSGVTTTVSSSSRTVMCKSVTYGSNIRKRKSSISFNGTKIPSYEIAMQSMKRNLCVIYNDNK